MFCFNCSKELGTKSPIGAHTVALGNCPRCKKERVGIWPMRHFFTEKESKKLIAEYK